MTALSTPRAACALSLTIQALAWTTFGCSVAPETAPPPTPAPSTTPAFTAFLTADRCAPCHGHSPTANALTTRSGDDASPHGTWQATAMANSFRDPYWRAQMSREVELAPRNKDAIESLCLTCHAPAASQTARLADDAAPTMAAALADPLANDGVSCTVCHRAMPDNLGLPASFGGHLDIRGDARIFGPFAEPAPGPMKMHTGFTPTHGEHVQRAALCGTCHTLYVQAAPDAAPVLEQGPYLEWRNSVFSDENGTTTDSRTCQACHMPDVGPMRIAHNPGGFEFNIKVRDDVRGHTFVGGNAFLIDMLRANAAELGVTATDSALARIAAATRAQLAHATARVEILSPTRSADRIEFDVRVENLTGHKLPTGYPARRVWLDVEVRSGADTLFRSGATDSDGRITGITDELAIPHVDRIASATQVAVYEMIAFDIEAHTTTSLTRMAARGKDNRLLPRGYAAGGPHVTDTRPIGTDGDDDFVAGSDHVTYSIALPASAQELLIIARARYQAIPPAWARALESSRSEESARFLRLYSRAQHAPETLATTALVVP